MSIWTTPANPDLELFPGATDEEIQEILDSIDMDEIHEKLANDEEFQKRLRAFRPRRISVETLFTPIY
ncbi:hypothetical protein LCGC14_2893220 [marine sediment metagenome]|uniref:Uncharacterized protein n=1 Tax=marine sediment metagenome TaxID=412755 RepID=A0A0F9AMS6_9ZZZZ